MNHQPLEPAQPPIPIYIRRKSSSEPSCASSELTTISSITSPHGSSFQTGGHRNGPLSVRSISLCRSNGTLIFENLQSHCTQEQIDTAIEDVTHWVDDLGVSPIKDRKKKLVELLSSVDGMFALDNQCGLKQCPADRSQASRRPQERATAAPLSRTLVGHRRKGIANSIASETSRHESEDSFRTSYRPAGSNSPFSNMLACPFAKHDRARYIFVGNSCTERFGFPTPGKLVEHLKRVHSLRVPCCVTCKQRFHGRTRAHAEEARRLHESTGQCQNRELTLSEPEWMTEEQDTRFASSMIQGHSSSPEEKWQSLYRQLFDVQNDSDIPHPYYDYLVPGRDSATAPDAEVGQTLPLTAHPAQGFLSEPSSLITTPLCQEGNAVSSSQLLSDLPLEALSNVVRPSDISPLHRDSSGPISLPHHDGQNTYTQANAFASSIDAISPGSLTAALLDLNESTQPQVPFSYEVYHGQDSGYQSLEQPLDQEAAELLVFSEFVKTVDGSDDAFQQIETGLPLSTPPDPLDTRLDLAGLEMEPCQFPNDASISRRRRNGFEL